MLTCLAFFIYKKKNTFLKNCSGMLYIKLRIYTF